MNSSNKLRFKLYLGTCLSFLFIACDFANTEVKIDYISKGSATILYDSCSSLSNVRCNSIGNINAIRNGSELKTIAGKRVYFMLSGPVIAHVRLFRNNKMCAENTYETKPGETTEFILDCEPK